MTSSFTNRVTAGQALARALKSDFPLEKALVLGLPRGGVPVAAEIARTLGIPLDILNVRKLGVPWHPELAMGAITEDGTQVLHKELIRDLKISPDEVDKVAAREQATLQARTQQFRQGQPAPDLKGRTVILVDDGLATGATMEAAIKASRNREPGRIVVAIPVGPAGTARHFSQLADDCICLLEPKRFQAVGLWYQQFDQVSDEEVTELLKSLPNTGRTSTQP